MAKFKGSVYQTHAFKEACKSSSFLKQCVSAFKTYWFDGYHPHIGKDVATSRPNPPEGHRHTHLRPDIFPSDKGYTRTQRCWDRWKSADIEIAVSFNSNDIPTSDHGLFYAVDTKRNAYLFHYQDADMHEFMDTFEFTEIVQSVEKMLEGSGIELLSIYKQSRLFEREWELASNDDEYK